MTHLKLNNIVVLLLLVAGCMSNENLTPINTTISFVTEPTESINSENSSTESSLYPIESDLVNNDPAHNDYDDLSNFVGRYENRNPYNVNIEILEQLYDFPSPGYVDVYVDNCSLYIGFIYEIGINKNFFPTLLDEIKDVDWPHSEFGESYMYYGKLEYLRDYVYASAGKWPKDLNLMEDICGENIDFYVVFKNNGLYVFFDEINPDKIYDSISIDDEHFVKYQGRTENYDGPLENSAN